MYFNFRTRAEAQNLAEGAPEGAPEVAPGRNQGRDRGNDQDRGSIVSTESDLASERRSVPKTVPSMTAIAFCDLVIGHLLPFTWKANEQLAMPHHVLERVIINQQFCHAPAVGTIPPAQAVNSVSLLFENI